MGRKLIPRPGFLATCTYLGYVYGERRWRRPRGGMLYTWDSLHSEVEASDARGEHLGVVDAMTGEPIKPGRKGRKIRAWCRNRGGAVFRFVLSRRGDAEQIDDFVGHWHGAPDSERRSLSEYLGMSEEEYGVWVMDPETLPVMRVARIAGQPLADAIGEYVAALRVAGRPVDRAALAALGNWLDSGLRVRLKRKSHGRQKSMATRADPVSKSH